MKSHYEKMSVTPLGIHPNEVFLASSVQETYKLESVGQDIGADYDFASESSSFNLEWEAGGPTE